MYHPAVIADTIARMERQFGFELREYSIPEVVDFQNRLITLWDDKGKQIRSYDADEAAFVQNELLMSKASFLYWVEHNAFINKAGSKLERMFPLWTSQKLILQEIGRLEKAAFDGERNDGALIDLLKARQLGGSTISQCLQAHRATTQNHVLGLIAADVPQQSAFLFDMFERIIEHLPFYLLPKGTIIEHVKNEEMKFEGGSNIWVGSGKSKRGVVGERGQIGRGMTLSVIHLCVAPGTLIQLASGPLKSIAEIQAGDRVITHRGNTAVVRAVAKSPRTNELTCEIWPCTSFAPLVVTHDHKLLTSVGWTAASEIRDGDWLVHPVRSITDEVGTFEFKTTHKGGRHTNRHAYPTVQPLNREWGYMLGLYLAEGSPTRSHKRKGELNITGIAWSLDVDEVADKEARLRAVWTERQPGVSRSNSRTRILRLHHTGLARWIVREFGHGDEKHVPEWAWRAGRDFCLGVVEGYLDGDGHWKPNCNEIYATSVRVALPLQIRDLIASLGFGWSSISYKAPGVYYERKCRAAWLLVDCEETGKKLRAACRRTVFGLKPHHHWQWLSPDRIAVQVEQVGQGFSNDFYDLEVEGEDHSFSGVVGVLRNSELSTWEDTDQITAALMPTVHETPLILVIFESSGRGRNNYWHKHWNSAVAGRSRFTPVFIPWYTEETRYSRRAPTTWTPSATTLSHANRCTETGTRWVHRSVHLNRDQLYWYETTRIEHEVDGKLGAFLENYSAEPEEAFQFTGKSIFPVDVLQRIADQMKPTLAVAEVGLNTEIQREYQ